MKIQFYAIGLAAMIFSACGSQHGDGSASHDEELAAVVSDSTETEVEEEVSYPYAAGAEFDASQAIDPSTLMASLSTFEGDTLETTLATGISACCQKKGCWMTLDMGEGNEEMLVQFLDYDFFVPLDAAGRETVVNGVVYKKEASVEELRHLAEDAGASADSIATITEPTVEWAFMASGVQVQ